MGVLKSTGKILGVFVNIRADQWFGFSDHKRNTKYITTRAKELFSVEQANRTEEFEEAMRRLNISDEQLQSTDRYYSKLVYLFVTMATILLAYAFYQIFIYKSLLSTIMVFSLSLYSLVFAFRYHFWRFQLRSRKLGCSFRDWLNS
ncbi:MAG: hypothetical protein HOI53_05285 [Francisellaceae bacterium]|jgi:intracellular multiplication protein IcmV|nr:hypothetical protein [Francisellaceae bacterium]MBT6207419.1 hypothetical protein [Francisellaceae bacterium]MBT6539514.1 hypothetical protein [Francisellaceae bacterium]